MKVGDLVNHKNKKKYGVGKILSFLHHQGTVLVKFEKMKSCTYHIAIMLEERKQPNK
jgi:hypothetical protein